jgi:hypothetical protein
VDEGIELLTGVPAAEIHARVEARLTGFAEKAREFAAKRRFASLPFAREIGSASASMRALSVSELERQFRRQARELEREIAAILGAGSWTLRVERASPLMAVEAALAQLLEPALLVPPGARLAEERRRVKKKELTKEALKQWLAAGRPVIVLPE